MLHAREPASKRTSFHMWRGPCCTMVVFTYSAAGSPSNCHEQLPKLLPSTQTQAASPRTTHHLVAPTSPLPLSRADRLAFLARRLQAMQADAKPPAARPGYTGDGAPGSEVSALLNINQHRKLDHAMPVRARTWHACSQRLWPPRAPRTTCIGPSGLVASTCPTIQDHLHCQPNAHCQPLYSLRFQPVASLLNL